MHGRNTDQTTASQSSETYKHTYFIPAWVSAWLISNEHSGSIFLAFDFFIGSAWSFVFFIPATTADFEDFYTRSYPLHLFSYLNYWERASIFPFKCSVLNKGTTGTIFITTLVWRGPWLGIEPGTSRTRSQHSTIRLSRRRWFMNIPLIKRKHTH